MRAVIGYRKKKTQNHHIPGPRMHRQDLEESVLPHILPPYCGGIGRMMVN